MGGGLLRQIRRWWWCRRCLRGVYRCQPCLFRGGGRADGSWQDQALRQYVAKEERMRLDGGASAYVGRPTRVGDGSNGRLPAHGAKERATRSESERTMT
eukprot:3938448-Rhodomonas_salina.1